MRSSLVVAWVIGACIVPPSLLLAYKDGELREMLSLDEPDFSGTYASGGDSACHASTNGRAPALVVVQHTGTISFRVVTSRGVRRLLHIERRESATHSHLRRNGLARWDGNELVVETRAPAFAMFGPHRAEVEGSLLTERFALVFDSLVYSTWYTAPNEQERFGPQEHRLRKCGYKPVI